MKLYVQRLPQILAKKKALAQHTAIAECIKDVTDGYDFLDSLQVHKLENNKAPNKKNII